ncbi:MAG: hypothetical protein IKI75_02845 [Lachnospiraceae bacterium]|nr:hypothetical protein [Lachnospiraceae bacterium]
MKKAIRYSAGIIPVTLLKLTVSYVLQIAVYRFIELRNTGMALGMMLAGPAAVILTDILFVVADKAGGWYDAAELPAVACAGSVIYGLMMFLVFPLIAIPYEVIPSGEMALGFGQLLIRAADCCGAAVSLLVSGILWLSRRKKLSGS